MDVQLPTFDLLLVCNVFVVGICIFNKIPQILTLKKTKSVVGVSLIGVIVELTSYSISLCYNIVQEYPLSSYFEYPFLVAQDTVLILYIFYLSGTLDVVKFGVFGLLASVFYGFVQGIPDPAVLQILIRLVAPIMASSKIINLRAMWTVRNTENVSVLAWSLSLFSCIVRIITTVYMTGDPTLLMNFMVGGILNCAIVGSAIYFKPKKVQGPSSPQTKKTD